MDIKRQKEVQLEYLRLGMPDNYSFSESPSLRKDTHDIEGIITYNNNPCALVIIFGKDHTEEEQKDRVRQLLRRNDLPYALVFVEDSWNFLMAENEEIINKGKIQVFYDVVQQAIDTRCDEFTKEDVAAFVGQLKVLCNKHALSSELKEYIDSLLAEDISGMIEIAPFELAWNLRSDFEQDLFTSLVGKCTETKLCRYTTLDSLFRILSNKKMSMCGIACMNDRSECYYVDHYLKESYHQRVSDFSLDEVRMLNNFFILSCSDMTMEDNLLMWRMYAKEATGVCLDYTVDISRIKKPFYLAKVSYAQKDGFHPELEFIRDCMNISIQGRRFRFKNLSLWKHFFKQYEYKDECEVRLLYAQTDYSKYKWIKTSDHIMCPVVEFNLKDPDSFPLTLSKVILGPKSPENDTNVSQIRLLLDCQSITTDKNFTVDFSIISSYR